MSPGERKRKLEKEEKANSRAAKSFFTKNAKAEGVVTHASGLQSKVLRSGTGETPAFTQKVMVHYRGLLLDCEPQPGPVPRIAPTIEIEEETALAPVRLGSKFLCIHAF